MRSVALALIVALAGRSPISRGGSVPTAIQEIIAALVAAIQRAF